MQKEGVMLLLKLGTVSLLFFSILIVNCTAPKMIHTSRVNKTIKGEFSLSGNILNNSYDGGGFLAMYSKNYGKLKIGGSILPLLVYNSGTISLQYEVYRNSSEKLFRSIAISPFFDAGFSFYTGNNLTGNYNLGTSVGSYNKYIELVYGANYHFHQKNLEWTYSLNKGITQNLAIIVSPFKNISLLAGGSYTYNFESIYYQKFEGLDSKYRKGSGFVNQPSIFISLKKQF